MTRILDHRFTLITLTLISAVVSVLLAQPTFADDSDRLIFKLQVQEEDGKMVNVSAPLSILVTLHRNLPKEARDTAEEMGLSPQKLIKEFKTLGERDLIRIEGKDTVRIWFEEPENRNDEALSFIKIQIKEPGDEKCRIDLCLPVGIVCFMSEVLNNVIQNEILHEKIDLPPEIIKLLKELKKM